MENSSRKKAARNLKEKPVTREWNGKPFARPVKLVDLSEKSTSEGGKRVVAKKWNDQIIVRPIREVELTVAQKEAVGKIVQTNEWVNATPNEKLGILRAIRKTIK